MKRIQYGNGIVKDIERDAENNYRLTHATATTSDAITLLDTDYSYDAISNITHITENGIEPLRKSVDYTYDPLVRLTHASYTYGLA